MLTIISNAAQKLASCTDVPQLEAEILLCHALNQPRSYLYSRSNETLLPDIENRFWNLIANRAQGEPIAYLTGHREFWSLDLAVTKDVLIPRPETELLVELILKKEGILRLADLGTGSGAIALAIASERPQWEIYATDQSDAALAVARENAKWLNLQNVVFLSGEWFNALPAIHFDVIVSNPPYLAVDDPHLLQGDLRYEPRSALVSGRDGLVAIREIILTAQGGHLFLEHGSQQGESVRSLFVKAGYTRIETHRDLSGLERVTSAIK